MFLSKKVAAQTGDLRKAFAICLKALDLIESETLASLAARTGEDVDMETPAAREPLRENVYLSSPSASQKHAPSPKSPAKRTAAGPMAHLRVETAPRATIAHVARVTAKAFGNGVVQRLQGVSLHGKAALCALAVLAARADVTPQAWEQAADTPVRKVRANEAAPSVKALYAEYTKLCTAENALPACLACTEFSDVLEGLETTGLISFVGVGTNGGKSSAPGTPSGRKRKNAGVGVSRSEERRVVSCVGVKDLKGSLDGGPGKGVLRAMMAEGLL
jgi:cell division control protein 6